MMTLNTPRTVSPTATPRWRNRHPLMSIMSVLTILHLSFSGCLATKAYIRHVHDQDPTINPLIITKADKATHISGAGVFICLVTQKANGDDPTRLGVFVPETTLQKPLDILTAKNMTFGERQYFVSQDLVLPNPEPQRYLFRSHRATDSCEVPDEIPIYRGAMMKTKGMPQKALPIVELASVDEIKKYAATLPSHPSNAILTHPTRASGQAQAPTGGPVPITISVRIENQPVLTLEGGVDNRVHARHYPILAGTFIVDVISVPIQVLLYMFIHPSD